MTAGVSTFLLIPFGERLVAIKSNKRELKRFDNENSHTPFSYDAKFLHHIRPDQLPRFLGCLTHPERLPLKRFQIDALCAIQNRVNTEKVEAIRKDDVDEHPVVVRLYHCDYIVDGHHRATADWLNGATHLRAHFKDLTAHDNAVKAKR